MVDPSEPQFEQLSGLVAALCDGEISRDESAQLERIVSGSPEAQQFFVRYLQMHGEICWAAGHGVGDDAAMAAPLPQTVTVRPAKVAGPAPRPLDVRSRKRRSRWLMMATAAAAVAVVGLVGFLFFGGNGMKTPIGAVRPVVARIEQTSRAQWAADAEAPQVGGDLKAGERIVLEQGLALVRFRSGATVVLDGPAELRLETVNRAALRSGSLVARVPREAVGFTVQTPSAKVVDRGTELGIAIGPNGGSDVHVFEGKVELQAIQPGRSGTLPMLLTAGRTVRVQLASNGVPIVTDLNARVEQFVRRMPPPGPSARLKALVSVHPDLIHYYTFEGATLARKHRDRCGALRLEKVVMAGGDGSGDLYELAPGIDSESNAVRPYRSPEAGNATGVALRTSGALPPRPATTVELLLKLEKNDGWEPGDTCAAIALRGEGGDGSGGSIGATEGGRLACRLGAAAPWNVTELALTPGEWYYVAATFRAETGQTRIDCYAANVTRGQRQLEAVVRGQRCSGSPPAGQVGIGASFGQDGQAVCPWQGILDEVAIYKAALPGEVLQSHLDALLGPP